MSPSLISLWALGALLSIPATTRDGSTWQEEMSMYAGSMAIEYEARHLQELAEATVLHTAMVEVAADQARADPARQRGVFAAVARGVKASFGLHMATMTLTSAGLIVGR